MCNQCYLQNTCNSCTDPNPNLCNPTYDCSPPLWQTWPRIEIKRCYLGCGCHGRKHHSETTESSESSYSHQCNPCQNLNSCQSACNSSCNNLCNNYCNPCQYNPYSQFNPCCDPTIGLCANGSCEELSSR